MCVDTDVFDFRLIEDDVDDDDENDNHHAIDLQNDDDTCHNDDVDNDNETSHKCVPNSLYPPIVNNPTQILSFPLINPKGSALPPCLQKTPPGLYHHDEFLSITVWRTLKGKTRLRLFNDSHN